MDLQAKLKAIHAIETIGQSLYLLIYQGFASLKIEKTIFHNNSMILMDEIARSIPRNWTSSRTFG